MTRKLGPLVALLVLLVVTAMGLWITSSSRRDSASVPLRVGINIWPGYGAFFIAEAKGFFQREGVSVETKIIQEDPEREASLISGRLDAIGMTLDNLALLRARGVDARAVYKYDGSFGADGIVAQTGLKSLKALRGKKVGWAPATTSHFFLAAALEREGMSTSDLNHVSVSSDEAGAAFAAGDLDAAVTWEPWLTKAKESGRGEAILTTREFPVIEDVLFFRGDVLKQRRADISKFLRACFDAVDYWRVHPDEGREIIARKLNLPVTDVRDMLGGVQVLGKAENTAFFENGSSNSPAAKAYDLAVRIWISEGVLKTPVSASEAIDGSLVRDLPN